MSGNSDPDFAPIEAFIRDIVGRQGFMNHLGAELSELTRGTCTIEVGRRPELLQQHGLFHGGVTWSTMRPRSQQRPRAASR